MPFAIFVKYRNEPKFKRYSDFDYMTEPDARYALQRMKAQREYRLLSHLYGAEFKIDKLPLFQKPTFNLNVKPFRHPLIRRRGRGYF